MLTCLCLATFAIRHAQSLNPADYLIWPKTEVEWLPDGLNSSKISWATDLKPASISFLIQGKSDATGRAITSDETSVRYPGSSITPSGDRTMGLITLADGKKLWVADRWIRLAGAKNFRDIGGYRTNSGYHVKWGKVFRSNNLGRLTPQDQIILQKLGLKTVCDVRGVKESQANPDKIPSSVQTLALPIEAGAFTKPGQSPATMTAAQMGEGYIRITDEKAKEVFGPWLRSLANDSQLPSVIHCTAGKDRTGVGIAILLYALGVPMDTVIADYSLTNLAADDIAGDKATQAQMKKMGYDLEKLKPLLIAYPNMIKAVLVHIDDKYGSVENYLKVACGVSATQLAEIRAELLSD